MPGNNDFPDVFNNKKNKTIAVVSGIVAALVAVTSLVVALSKFSVNKIIKPVDDTEESEEVSVIPEVPQPETSESAPQKKHIYYDKIHFEKLNVRNESVTDGALAVIKEDSDKFPYIDQSKLANIAKVKTPNIYDLSNVSLVMYEEAIKSIDKFLVAFNESVPKNSVIINKGYTTPERIQPSDGIADLTTGYSVKLQIYNAGSAKFTDEKYSFLREQAYKYGVILRYPVGKVSAMNHESDLSIYRYVGMAHSYYMNKYNLSLEEYIDKIKTEKVIEYESDFDRDTVYVSYYVPASDSDETTYIDVPVGSSFEYTVSGDGSEGFIVTVTMKKSTLN